MDSLQPSEWSVYIQAEAERRGIAKYAWWHQRFQVIQAALHGRYTTLRLGWTVEPPEAVLRFIWSGRKKARPKWACHKKPSNAWTKLAVLDIIAEVDRRARRNNEADNRSQEAR